MAIKIPKVLKDMLREGNCGLFIGAGISMSSPSNLPGWRKLLEGMITYGLDQGEISEELSKELNESMAEGQYLEVADHLAGTLRGHYRRYLVETIDAPGLKPNENHRLIANIETPLTITTNYDKLLEVCMNNPLTCFLSQSLLELLHKPGNRKKLLKIHGSISDPENLILSEKDYTKLISREDLTLVTQSYFHRYSFLFLGCSLTDPDILMFLKNLNNVFYGSTSSHYAIVEKGKFSNIQAEYFKRIYNILLIPYEERSEITTFLKEIVELQQEVNQSTTTVKREYLDEIHNLNILEYYISHLVWLKDYHLDAYVDAVSSELTEEIIKWASEDYLAVKRFMDDMLDQLNLENYSEFPLEIFKEYHYKLVTCLKLLDDDDTHQDIDKKIQLTKFSEYICFKSSSFFKLLFTYVKRRRIIINLQTNKTSEEEIILENYNGDYRELLDELSS